MGIGTGRVEGAWIKLLMSCLTGLASQGSIVGFCAYRLGMETVHEPGAWGKVYPRSGWNVCQRGVKPSEGLFHRRLFALGGVRGFD
jgi:hypothetical protein